MVDRRPSIEELQEKAVQYFCNKPNNFPAGRPYNCCESVLLALSEYMGVSSELIPKIGTAIGAGVGLNGLLCGSVSSVAMAIGIKYGRKRPEESPKLAWDIVNKYVASFKDEFGAVDCRQLTGLNLKTSEGLQEYYSRVHDLECTKRLRFAVEKGIEILSENRT